MARQAFARRYVTKLHSLRYAIIGFWLVLAVVGAIFAPQFYKLTDNAIGVPPKGSMSARADSWFQAHPTAHAPSVLSFSSAPFALFIWSDSDENLFSPGPRNQSMKELSAEVETAVRRLGAGAGHSQYVRSFTGYFPALNAGLPALAAERFVSPGGVSTLFPFVINTEDGGPSPPEFAGKLQAILENDILPSFEHVLGPLGAQVLGVPAFLTMIQDSVERDMAIGDGTAIPLALAVVAYVLRSLRLLILPLVTLMVAAAVSFGIMYIPATQMHVMSTTASLMATILIAMSLDYGLFLLTRLQEGLRHGLKPLDAVVDIIATAGHTISVSGLTLTFAFFGLLLMPVESLRGLGLGSGLAVCIVLAANLTFLPSLILVFPRFFTGVTGEVTLPSCLRRGLDAKPGSAAMLVNDEAVDPLLPGPQSDHAFAAANFELSELEVMRKSKWYRLGQLITRWPWNILVVLGVVGCTAPFAYFSVGWPVSGSVDLGLDRWSKVTHAFNRCNQEFGYGFMTPFTLAMASDDNVLSAEFFTASQSVINQLIQLPNTNCSVISGVSYALCNEIPLTLVQSCLHTTGGGQLCAGVRALANSSIVEGVRAAQYSILLDFDPLSPSGRTWFLSAVALLEKLEKETPHITGLYLAGGEGWDEIGGAMDAFPLMIGLTAGAILIFIGSAFRSIVIPLRSLITIGVTIAFVFGFASLTYVHGAMTWTHFWGLADSNALLWMPPLVSFSICVGLSIDYDLFLLVRIREMWLDGHDTREAICRGLYKSGGIISAAGIIMAIAFSGLLFSGTPAMNQLAFYLVFAVLYDTFIVRPLLVPSLFSLGMGANWWPGSRCTEREQRM